MRFDLTTLPRLIDISGVRANVTRDEIDQIAAAAAKYRFVCAFAMPCFTAYLAEKLKAYPDIAIGGVVGFPSGADTTEVKVFQAREMLKAGATELDMVINVGALKSGMDDAVYADIRAVVEAAGGTPVKSILEIAYLTDEEIARACEIAVRAGVTFVKSGTGWAAKPTTVETIRVMKAAVGDCAKIKAAGGVRGLDAVLAMIDAGCERFGLGISTALDVMKEVETRLQEKQP